MKKVTLAFTLLLGFLGLAACSSTKNDNVYRGEILFAAQKGNNLKLTIRKNDCKQQEGGIKEIVLSHSYDSHLVVGSCVEVSHNDDGITVTNISRKRSSSWLSRTSKN
ncbi:hypothetical protein [Histophilus somni]|uniref:Lipoprotein n=1 Tax=Histophilus somni (strain 129Pt) TaxID=205914 RepID=Q0I3B2_HISS1|nr:hypothetical protein [Histophilus somni]